MDKFILYETEHFRVEHSKAFLVPGYLFVVPKTQCRSLTELPAAAVSEMGDVLVLATSAVEAIVKPIITYCAKFGESDSDLHFHVLPRTAWLTTAFCRAFPNHRGISGPVLLDWVNHAFVRGRDQVEYEGSVSRTISALRRYFDKSGDSPSASDKR
jgi:diadenosine tetraphosphate (Ap4A) HIT family hydrolase